MSDSEGNLNPTASVFLPANLHPIHVFVPTRIHLPPLPPPPYPCLYPNFARPWPSPLPPTSLTPTRAVVLLLPIPADVNESSIRRDLELFGEVRGVQMERASEGIVTVHFYDLRDSQRALSEIRERHMRQEQVRFVRGYTAARGLVSGRTVWTHFVFPQLTAVPEGHNQGSLVVMNLEPTVSSTTLRQIFIVYGEVKELRETPYKRSQRFVEFYDVRDAARALHEMNGKAIDGKQIVIQFSRPGGFSKKHFFASRFNKSFLFNHHHQPPSPVNMKPFIANMTLGDNQRYEKQQRKNNKKRLKKNLSDGGFIIKEDESCCCRDGRTTVMIKNIPNTYTQKLLLKMLDTHCNDCNQKIISQGSIKPMSSYNFVYLPMDYINKSNVGYGFVNMTTPEAVWRLYKTFHNQPWRVFKCRKICEITYARIQGVESLKEHFKKSRLPGVEMEKNMPVLFTPPRDGMLLMKPISIVVDLKSKPVAASSNSRDKTVFISCISSDKVMDGSDGCVGERIGNGGVSAYRRRSI